MDLFKGLFDRFKGDAGTAEILAKSDEETKDAKLVRDWCKEWKEAQEREKEWRKSAKEVVKLYEADKQKDDSVFNILYSNVETLGPALYNSVPRPVVQRRFKDEDPLGMEASKLAQRLLAYYLDTNLQDNSSFDELMKSAVLEALVPGRGVTWFKYDAKIEEKPLPLPPSANSGLPGDEEESTEPPAEKTFEEVTDEQVVGEEVPWDRFAHGYGKKWRQVPWIGRLHVLSKQEFTENFGEPDEEIKFTSIFKEDSDDDRSSEDESALKVVEVYEIWDKATRKVYFICPTYKVRPIKVEDDPLQLQGFFPIPRPMALFARVSGLTPQTLYSQYQQQAKELNDVSQRIMRIIRALKVRGFYDSTVEGIENLMTADDNTLLPAQNVAALQQGMSLEKAIFLMPLDKLVLVLQQLYKQRQEIKTIIYELTGIADIMRGSSMASETLGAQKIKDRWGTLRLKRMQGEVQRYARDCLRIVAEIAVTKFSPDTVQKMTGLPYKTQEQQMQDMMLFQQQQQLQPPPQPGQPPAPPAQPPAQGPSLEEILELLQNDIMRSYRIDIETNSTVDLEATEDKENVGELLNALAQFFNGVAPIIQNGTLPFEAGKAMLLGIIRKFRFGEEIEEQLKTMKQPPPPPNPADDPKAKIDLQVAQMEADTKKQELSLQLQLAKKEHAFKMAEMDRKMQMAEQRFRHQMAQAMMPKPAPMVQNGQQKPKSAGITSA